MTALVRLYICHLSDNMKDSCILEEQYPLANPKARNTHLFFDIPSMPLHWVSRHPGCATKMQL